MPGDRSQERDHGVLDPGRIEWAGTGCFPWVLVQAPLLNVKALPRGVSLPIADAALAPATTRQLRG